MKRKIVLTGGGTAGHVTPNIALIEELSPESWQVHYIGSTKGIEKEMMNSCAIPYYAIATGKLSRYFSWKNALDPVRIIIGIMQSFWLLRTLKADVVFSKGGFVAFPVVVGAWLNRIPVVAHESDLSPGLANRLSFPFVNKICINFPASRKYFKHQDKIAVTGTPIRSVLFKGNKEQGLAFCGFVPQKPCLLIIGGSQGSISLNHCIRQALPLLEEYQIIHLCGKDKIDPSYLNHEGYKQFEYVNEELANLYAACDLIISRAGANTLYEILSLAKPHILIPLSQQVSRGDQIENARYYQQQGISQVIPEEELTPQLLSVAIKNIKEGSEERVRKMKELNIRSATVQVIEMITSEIG